MESWLTHTLSALGGALASCLPVGLWAWSVVNKIRGEAQRVKQELDTKAERDSYEMDKIRRSDAYQELSHAVEQLKKDFAAERDEWKRESAAMNQKIAELQARELDCLRKSSLQEAEIITQKKITEYLEARVRTLESSLLPSPPPSSQVALAGAVRDMAKEAIAESKVTK